MTESNDKQKLKGKKNLYFGLFVYLCQEFLPHIIGDPNQMPMPVPMMVPSTAG